jgi:hypothetical protein
LLGIQHGGSSFYHDQTVPKRCWIHKTPPYNHFIRGRNSIKYPSSFYHDQTVLEIHKTPWYNHFFCGLNSIKHCSHLYHINLGLCQSFNLCDFFFQMQLPLSWILFNFQLFPS